MRANNTFRKFYAKCLLIWLAMSAAKVTLEALMTLW
jgi:hypothetical protein